MLLAFFWLRKCYWHNISIIQAEMTFLYKFSFLIITERLIVPKKKNYNREKIKRECIFINTKNNFL